MFNGIYRRLMLPYRAAQRRRDLLAGAERLKEKLSASPEAVASLRSKMLNEMAVHAAATSPFWTKRFREAGVDPQTVRADRDLLQLPILEKDDIRQSGSEMLSSAFSATERRAAMTGGSTAAPLTFYRNRECETEREANRWLYYLLMGRTPYDRSGLVWGAMRDLGNTATLRSRFYDRLMERVEVLPGNRLDETSMTAFLGRLYRFRATFLHGYAGAIYLLATHVRQHRLTVPKLKSVTITAEPSIPEQQAVISSVFGCPVYNVYGTREFGFLAAEVPNHKGMYINPLNAVVEIITSSGAPAKPGESGQVVVTDLLNRAMPLIRYRIGDIAIPVEPPTPECNYVTGIEILAGRETDFIVTPSGRMISGASMTLITAHGVAKLRYIQRLPGNLHVEFVRSAEFDGSSVAELEKNLRTTLGPQFQFTFAEVPDLRPAESGKFEYVRSEVSRQQVTIS